METRSLTALGSEPAADRALAAWSAFWFAPRDAFTLAVVRIVVGAIAFYWAASFTPDLLRFFGPDGLVPVRTLHQFRGSTFPLSLLEVSFLRSPGAIWAVHGISLVVLAAFTAGLWTRATSILALCAVLSYVHRAPMLMTPAEPVLVMLLAYLCVGPCGSLLSLDAWRRRRTLGDRPHLLAAEEAGARLSWSATLSTRLIQVHLTLAYGAMALAKVNDRQFVAAEPGTYHPWWQGEAVWWLAARPYSPLVDVTPLLTDWPLVVAAWTHAIVLFEAAFAIFIWRPALRPLLLWLAVPMWLSLALITGWPVFCLLMLAANLAFVQSATLRRIAARWA